MALREIDESEYLKNFDLTHLFIKFIDAKFIDSFFKRGELHFERFSKFNTMENSESGDPNEGTVALELKNAKGTFKVITGNKITTYSDINLEDINMQYANDQLTKYGLTSMFYVNQLDGFEVEEINKTNYPYENTSNFSAIGKIDKEVLYNFSSFLEIAENQSKVPILMFPNKLIQRLSEKKIQLLRGSVEYYDISDAAFFEKIRREDIYKTLFVKTNNYSHQKEYRFVLPEEIPKNGKNVYLGNMDDIAIRLDKNNLENYRAYYKDGHDS